MPWSLKAWRSCFRFLESFHVHDWEFILKSALVMLGSGLDVRNETPERLPPQSVHCGFQMLLDLGVFAQYALAKFLKYQSTSLRPCLASLM